MTGRDRKILMTALMAASVALAVVHARAARGAAGEAGAGNDCVWADGIEDWRRLDRRNLVVWGPLRKDVYRVELSIPLSDLAASDTLAFIDHNHDGRICGFGLDAVVTPGGALPRRSSIAAMTRLDARALQQLADQYHVRLDRARDRDAVKPGNPETPAAPAGNEH